MHPSQVCRKLVQEESKLLFICVTKLSRSKYVSFQIFYPIFIIISSLVWIPKYYIFYRSYGSKNYIAKYLHLMPKHYFLHGIIYKTTISFRSLSIGNERMCENLQYKSDISNDIYPAMANDSCLTPCTQVSINILMISNTVIPCIRLVLLPLLSNTRAGTKK